LVVVPERGTQKSAANLVISGGCDAKECDERIDGERLARRAHSATAVYSNIKSLPSWRRWDNGRSFDDFQIGSFSEA